MAEYRFLKGRKGQGATIWGSGINEVRLSPQDTEKMLQMIHESTQRILAQFAPKGIKTRPALDTFGR